MIQQTIPGVDVRQNWHVLEVGSGPNRLLPQSVTLDVNPTCRPDVLHDLNAAPYPFRDASFDLVVCCHVLEHVDDLVTTIGELHRVLTRKAGRSDAEARSAIRAWTDAVETSATTAGVFTAALDLAFQHRLQIFDAIIFAAAEAARCDLLCSEDLQEGFRWRGVLVVNPFAPTGDPRLVALLGS